MTIKKNDIGELRKFIPLLPSGSWTKLRLLIKETYDWSPKEVADRFREASLKVLDPSHKADWKAVCHVCADLVEQGWKFYLHESDMYVKPPSFNRHEGESVEDVKARIRSGLKLFRDRQLNEPSVRSFLRKMQCPQKTPNLGKSISDLIDVGRDLAAQFREVVKLSNEEQLDHLKKIIDPAIEVCRPGDRDEVTGMRLLDIWRYMRHTWSLEFRPMPARKFPLLIRNNARPNRPIIGIAMLASPTIRLGPRDVWIGWDSESFRKHLNDGSFSPKKAANVLERSISNAIQLIRYDDLASNDEVKRPTNNVVLRLEQRAQGEELRRRVELAEMGSRVELRRMPVTENGKTDWLKASSRSLFVKKRASSLEKLLRARMMFQFAGLRKDPESALMKLFASREGYSAIETALAETRKRALASQVADVSVCGAIAPYNVLLAGKLVALVLASKEVRTLYRDRYKNQASEIASQLAGRPVSRSSDLLVLTTMSLYGIASSQYNRIRLSREKYEDLGQDLVWEDLQLSSGFGTAHLSNSTVKALLDVSIERHGIRRINQLFGEGSSPRLRQIREGLNVLGIHSENVLNHATPRRIYACELIPGGREYLLGVRSGYIPRRGPSIRQIGEVWRRRWLLGRIQREETLRHLETLGPESVQVSLRTDEDDCQHQLSLPLVSEN